MDEHTLKLLEFDKIRELVARCAPSALGRDRILSLVPSTDRAAIQRAQQLVAEMVRALGLRKSPSLGDLVDIRTAVRRARSEAVLQAEKLREVAATLHGLKQLRASLITLAPHCPSLGEYSLRVHDLSRVAHEIDGVIDVRGRVVDSASRELARLRHEIGKLEQRIHSLMRRLLRSETARGALRYPNFTVSGSHYVLPVAKDHRHDVTGVVHRTSASGDTLFIEPAEVAELSAEIALLRSHESKEVKRVLRRLSGEVGKHAAPIQESIEAAAELSVIYAKARFARDYRMVAPVFSDDAHLCLDGARHPLLEHLFRKQAEAALPLDPEPRTLNPPPRTVVPITVHLGSRFDVLVVTGPNTGGKTVTLKTVGLLAAMAQAGLHIPAVEGSILPIFDQVLADIGDEQSIEQSLSTFSSHISRIVGILRQSTEHSLVLLDELGAGTDPAEGAALGRAILDRLVELRAKAIVTTHLGDLKLYALAHPRVENVAVEFDVETLQPTYHLRIGETGRSSALVIARRLNLPGELVDRAEEYLTASRIGRSQEMEVLEQRRAEAEAARLQAWQAEQEARQAKEAYEARLRALEQDAADAQSLEEFRAALKPGDIVHVRKFRRAGTVLRVDPKRRIATISHGSKQWELPLDELMPQEK